MICVLETVRSQIYDLKGLIDIKEYVAWVDKEIYRNFQKRLEASRE